MGKYTTELRYICETNTNEPVDGSGFNSVDEIIAKSRANIFNFDYPIFDLSYKPILESKILRHYYTREICEETVGLWKLRLEDKLNLIMPYYNQMYRSELIEFNPMYDVDITTTHGGSKEGSKTDNGNKTEMRGTSEDVLNGEIITNNESTTNSENSVGFNVESSNRDKTANQQNENTGASATNNNLTESGNATSNTANNDNVTTTNSDNKLDKYSDTPQGSVTNLTNGFLTNVRDITENKNDTTNTLSASTGTSNTSNNKTENTVSTESNTGKLNRSENDEYNSTNSQTQNRDVSENRIVNGSKNKNESRNKTESKTSAENATTTMTNIEQYIEHVQGKRGTVSYSKMLQEFRKTFLNIDAMIIEELNDLFFGLW